MYRDYENPLTLERELREAEKRLKEAEKADLEAEELWDIQMDISDLKERINFAWSDEEFEEEQEQ